MKLDLIIFESVPPGDLPKEVARRLKHVLPWSFKVAAAQPDPPPVDPVGAIAVEQVFSLLPQSGRHDELAVAITGYDLITGNLSSVFGYASPERRVAAVSLHRLKHGTQARRGGRRLLVERTAKEILHEAGHLMGLPHCDHFGCVMQYSQTLHDTDIKQCRFCQDCLKELSRLPEPAADG